MKFGLFAISNLQLLREAERGRERSKERRERERLVCSVFICVHVHKCDVCTCIYTYKRTCMCIRMYPHPINKRTNMHVKYSVSV